MRIKEYQQHIHHSQADKSAIAEHSINHDHVIKFQETQILANKSGYMDMSIREATELDLHSNNTHREGSL
jgi:hypothetical protein